jgi:glucose/mannose transport system substrate-binding protein
MTFGKRRLGAWLLTAAFSAIGCSGGGSTHASNDVEIFSWWIHPGEIDALNALLGVVKTEAPTLQVTNSAASVDYGTDTQQILTDRMRQGNPPDTFQIHGGAELIDQWVVVNGSDSQSRMESLNFLYQSQGWYTVFPPKLVDALSYNGNVYSVPMNIHRGNIVFYNAHVLAAANLTPPTTWDEFFAVGDALKAAGMVPLALGGKDNFGLGMIFDAALLAEGGADYYNKFFQGQENPASDPQLANAVQILVKVMNYVQPDPGTKTWSDAADILRAGNAAMMLMGDWCKAYLVQENMKEGTDFGVVTAPDTAGSFIFITDTFGLPKGAAHRDNAIQLLTILGTTNAEDAFNPIKGSIPARTDADRSKYDDMAKQSMTDYSNASASTDSMIGLVPSMAHGSAAPPAFLADFNSALAAFQANPDGNNLIQAIVNIYPRLVSN